MKVRIDPDLCAGHGRCYSLAPEVYDADEQGHGIVIVEGELTEDLRARAELGVQNCPEGAITLVD